MDISQDWNESVGNLKLEIFAKDDREMFDLHFVTIPASDGNAFAINRFPLQDEDFLDAFRYLLATEDSDIQLMDGWFSNRYGYHSNQPCLNLRTSSVVDAMDVDADGQPAYRG